jgi:hypothetical protein
MKHLFAREMRRLAVPALAMFALGVVLLFFYYGTLVLLGGGTRLQYLELALWVVAWGTPWLLGATAFAPDHETGAESFLAALPVSRVKLLAMRASSALFWSVAVIGAFFLTFKLASIYLFGLSGPRSSTFSREVTSGVWLLGVAGAFLAASLAAIATRRTLVAFVTAPLFALVPLGLIGWVNDSLGAPSIFHAVGIFAVPPLMATAAALAYLRVGDRRAGRHALRTVCLVLAGGVGLAISMTSVGFAYDRLLRPLGEPSVELSSADHTVSVDSARTTGQWNRRNYYASIRHRVLFAADPEHPWELPAGTFGTSLSADGRTLLVFNTNTQRYGLADIEARQIRWGARQETLLDKMLEEDLQLPLWEHSDYLFEPMEPSTGVAAGWAAGLTHDRRSVAWAGTTPYLTLNGSRVYHRWDGREKRTIPAGASIESTNGGKVVVRYSSGEPNLRPRKLEKRTLLDLASGVELPLNVPAHTTDVLLSPSARWLFLFEEVRGSDRIKLSVLELHAGTVPREIALVIPRRAHPRDVISTDTVQRPSADVQGLTIHVSPTEEHAIVSWYADSWEGPRVTQTSRAFLLDLAQGSATAILSACNPGNSSDVSVGQITWSADSTSFECAEGRGDVPATPAETLILTNGPAPVGR